MDRGATKALEQENSLIQAMLEDKEFVYSCIDWL